MVFETEPAARHVACIFLRDQLGLRLESQRGLVDILKIGKVEKVPTEN
jgi:uncharacterized protein (TIGR03435 family)